jgi:hypothetical protein
MSKAKDLKEYFKSQQTPFLNQINSKNDFFAYKTINQETGIRKALLTKGKSDYLLPQIEYSFKDGILYAEITSDNNFDFVPYFGKLLLDQVINHQTINVKIKLLAHIPHKENGRIAHFSIELNRKLGDKFNLFFEMNVLNDFIDFSLFYVVLLILICKWTILILVFLKEIIFISKSNYEYNIWYNIKVRKRTCNQ